MNENKKRKLEKYQRRQRKLRRKAQIRMSETIAIIFIFFVLILFGVVFYYKYSQISNREKQEELLANRAMDAALQSLFLPELICTKGEAEHEDNCFDIMKLNQAEDVFSKNLNYYFNLFSYAKITVTEVYPGNLTWTVYDKQKVRKVENGTERIWENKENTYYVVALRNDSKIEGQRKYNFGYLEIEVYS